RTSSRASITTAERATIVLLALCSLTSAAEAPRRGRLAAEKSPYLLQHAADAVDWRPWGPEAIAEAKREGKPIFLSIGFSTCHWCHVMRRESFADPEIGDLLNAHFVPVLVDREERPDVDRAYMRTAEAAGWTGGWPLNLWLTPDRKAFFGGSYFPPELRGGRPGLKELLPRIAGLWRERRDDAVRDADDVGRALEAYSRVEASTGPPAAAALDGAFKAYRRAFDAEHGGFGPPPRFPEPSALAFLLRYHARTGRKEALDMAARTLRAIAGGGLHDRIGGGFHRYAAGAAWDKPHYEKMLTDNAQLASIFLDAHLAARDPAFALAARETLDYLLRDMARPGGGFHTAEDADEAYYALASAEARAKRTRPFKDDKILAGHNGLALSALAKGARALDEPRYLRAAEETARFLLAELYDAKENRLYRRWRDGERAIPGFAEDYAFLAAGLLDLYETSFDRAWQDLAARLTEATPARDPGLPLLEPGGEDGALPSAEAVAAMNGLRLAALTGREEHAREADSILRRFGGRMARAPRSFPAMLSALDFKLSKTRKISVYGRPDAADTRALLREVRRRYLPNAVVEFTARHKPAKATVCVGSSCSL
ncbi:MAG: thioredoxin domain-containing protein, partial [Elusimicrobia bacterium]|nr:thioredoxin domain-containing protein [Elusimicrobiota bacterium]